MNPFIFSLYVTIISEHIHISIVYCCFQELNAIEYPVMLCAGRHILSTVVTTTTVEGQVVKSAPVKLKNYSQNINQLKHFSSLIWSNLDYLSRTSLQPT